MAQIYYFLGHEQWQPEELIEHAQLAEQVGFDGLAISEHFHPWVDDHAASGFAWSTLGAIAQATSSVKLMTAVTTPLFRYHPAIIAQAAATVERLSSGRFQLGIGTGENINEGPLGYTFPKYAERATRMSEAIEIIRRLLLGEKVSFDGQYYQLDSAKLYSPPKDYLPIFMAAGGPKSARLAVEKCDGIITSVKKPTDTLEKVINPATQASKTRPQIVATRWSVFAENEDQAWQALLPWRGLRAPGRLQATDPAELRQKADQLPRSEILEKYAIISSAEEYVTTYKPLITEINADIIVIQTTSLDQSKTIKLLGSQVLPKLKDNI